MSNKLEKFIHDNREEFDSEEPRPQLWKNLSAELKRGKKDERVFHLSFLRWTAAAAIIVMVIGMFYYMNRKQSIDTVATKTDTEQPSDEFLKQVPPTYAKELYHFTQLIELKQNELKQIEKEQPELYRQFVKDIHKLDSSYQALRAALPANPDPETLLEAMIQNLRLQADLLNQQLTIIKEIKQSKKDSHEKNTRSL
ncbi:MAG TPA: hypothetical protein VD993_06705 [Chitinophagaceae bacterium]|nr:hypothetical protein [Chitinophagaceae bacterium]